jgi:riboflavin kinase / FMN adenylyltransferase
VRGIVLPGVANIGKNPTFGNSEVSYEVHLLDFDSDLLGETVRINFVDRIRGERTFPDAAALEHQIREDIRRAGELLQSGDSPDIVCNSAV